VGLFAIRDIPKDTNPFPLLKKISYIAIDEKELKNELPEEVFNMIDEYCAKERTSFFIPMQGFNPIDLPYLINHSDKPNVGTDYEGEFFYALRDIKKGEELFSDFSTYHDGNEDYIKKSA